ncbi:MAG: aspartate--ammonia ligase [Defluviitaleaceae bacterium]|nr:aspartate--ammonia ligase [Defluviitaleaceae bacterium]
MSNLIVPQGYKSLLSVYETQVAIGHLHRIFEENLCKALNLCRVSAPLFVEPQTGLNDDLSGVERPVEFEIKETGTSAQIVHSLAKWKRMALHRYDFHVNNGLYTDMNAIRRDDEMDNLHSIYVDQWDWEKIIAPQWRTREYLRQTVDLIVGAICDTAKALQIIHPALDVNIARKVKFITTQELADLYPGLTPKERENAIAQAHKTVFLMQIGGALNCGNPHDGRAPDYDDWQLNGDILFWHDVLGCAMEISSMGIRVDEETLDAQLTAANCDHRRQLTYHRDLLEGKLPLTIGGGIGQSRLSMLLLQKAHVGEVQVSVWDEETLRRCAGAGIELL